MMKYNGEAINILIENENINQNLIDRYLGRAQLHGYVEEGYKEVIVLRVPIAEEILIVI